MKNKVIDYIYKNIYLKGKEPFMGLKASQAEVLASVALILFTFITYKVYTKVSEEDQVYSTITWEVESWLYCYAKGIDLPGSYEEYMEPRLKKMKDEDREDVLYFLRLLYIHSSDDVNVNQPVIDMTQSTIGAGILYQ